MRRYYCRSSPLHTWTTPTGLVAGGSVAGTSPFDALVLRGRGDVISRAAGSGVLDEGILAARSRLAQDIEQGKVVPPGIADTDAQPSGP